MLHIKVLGSGCPKCKKLEEETRLALDNSGISYELTKVTDFADIGAYGVMHTPALVLNETIVSVGKIPKRDQILQWAQAINTQ